ncbi:creatininase [Oceanobacillus jeddahense]|uniref:creatininase n=1 Tax=Oceanobacillus jeddahense TaxID=1462527 RepID=UPI0005959125|nr:creatininase [Oceanobacillus jeddahense]
MTVLMSEMTWDEYEKKVKDSVIFLPVGATEQHGYHLPLGVDFYQIEKLSELVAENVNGIVAPTIQYGYKSQPHSGGGQIFPGTTSLSAQTLILLVKDILLEFIRHGATKFAVMDGHYENKMFLAEAIDLVLKEANRDDIKVVKCCFTDMLDEEVVTKLFPNGFPGYDLEHAALIETAMMCHFYPNLVHKEKIISEQADNLPRYEIFPQPEGIVPNSGVLADPIHGTAASGKIIIENLVKNYVEMIETEF